jgi:putative cardiolipin synthase
VFAIAGGRNIADDYFMRGNEANFIDMDALIAGAVVAELGSIFDRYWNSRVVLPVESVSPSTASREDLVREFERKVGDARSAAPLPLPATDLLAYGPVGEDLDGGRIGLVWGKAMAIADPPDKLARDAEQAYADSLAFQALMKIWTAEHEVAITSPYLIPGAMGIEAFEALGARKVKVTVLTNSLAATDEPLVHTGYARYRHRLLDSGVDLYELSPTRSQRNKRLGLFGSSVGRLHAKTAAVDGRYVFVGSMNLDPRSKTQNTELGVYIDSPQPAHEMLRVINLSKLQGAYRVRKSPQGGSLQWLALEDDGEVVLDIEPESSWWMRVHNFVFGLFVPEQLL